MEELNLRGEVCPYTFVKTKLALERMEPGQVLRVIVDNDQSGKDVPRSVAGEGHQVLDVAREGEGAWAIVIRKVQAGARRGVGALAGGVHAG